MEKNKEKEDTWDEIRIAEIWEMIEMTITDAAWIALNRKEIEIPFSGRLAKFMDNYI